MYFNVILFSYQNIWVFFILRGQDGGGEIPFFFSCHHQKSFFWLQKFSLGASWAAFWQSRIKNQPFFGMCYLYLCSASLQFTALRAANTYHINSFLLSMQFKWHQFMFFPISHLIKNYSFQCRDGIEELGFCSLWRIAV